MRWMLTRPWDLWLMANGGSAQIAIDHTITGLIVIAIMIAGRLWGRRNHDWTATEVEQQAPGDVTRAQQIASVLLIILVTIVLCLSGLFAELEARIVGR